MCLFAGRHQLSSFLYSSLRSRVYRRNELLNTTGSLHYHHTSLVRKIWRYDVGSYDGKFRNAAKVGANSVNLTITEAATITRWQNYLRNTLGRSCRNPARRRCNICTICHTFDILHAQILERFVVCQRNCRIILIVNLLSNHPSNIVRLCYSRRISQI